MFGRRRRPLLRAAAVGGAGYAIGKRRSRGEGESEDAEYEDETAPETDEAEAAPEASDSVGLGDAALEELEKLGSLKERGVLTQQEFEEQKAKILDAP